MLNLIAPLLLPTIAADKTIEARYTMKLDGDVVGHSVLKKTLKKDGSIEVHSWITFSQAGANATLDDYDRYDKNGNPIKAIHSQPLRGGGKRVVTKDYSPGLCKFSLLDKNKLTKSDLKIDLSKSTADTSVFWFIKTRPKPGTVVSYWTVGDNNGKWQLKHSQYVGPAMAVIGKKKYKGHLVIVTNGSKYILGDDGMPIRMAIAPKGEMTYEREGLK